MDEHTTSYVNDQSLSPQTMRLKAEKEPLANQGVAHPQSLELRKSRLELMPLNASYGQAATCHSDLHKPQLFNSIQ